LKRILQIVFSAHGTIGGQQTHLSHILDGLDNDLYHVDVVNWDVPESVAELERRGINVLVVKSRRILDLGLLRRLTEHIRGGGYDLVHAHGHRGGLLGRVAAIRARAPAIVWTCHVAENKADGGWLSERAYARLLRWLDARTDATIAVSPELKDWLIEIGLDADRIEVVRNCVDPTRFRPRHGDPDVVRSLGLEEKRPVVGTIARLTEQKGLACLLRAAARVLQERPEVQFVIVGKGPLGDELRRLAEELGIAGDVVFAGQRSDVPEVISTFDLAVVPSLWEGAFSYVPLEIMSSRKPLICSDIPHFKNIVGGTHAALMVPAGSSEELARAVLEMLNKPEEAGRMAREGYDLVRADFDIRVMQQRMREIYDRLVEKEAG